MRIAILIHGIGHKAHNERKGLGLIGAELEKRGWHILWLPLGRYLILRVLLANSVVARMVAAVASLLHDTLDQTVVCIGHSNGAAIAAEASRAGAPFAALAFISGAVSRKPRLGLRTDWVLNYYTGNDWILKIARVFRFDPDWGDAGEEKLSKELAIPHADIPLKNWGVKSHNGALKPSKAELIGAHIAESLEQWLSG